MGVQVDFLLYLSTREVFPRGGSILDIGAQNVYVATPKALRQFYARHGQKPIDQYDSIIEKLCAGAARDENGYRNDTFLSDVIAHTDMSYTAFDIFPGPSTVVFDLNHDKLPRRHWRRYDLVLNFGTTEHVINQYNALRVIHDATKTGGWMFHQLPASGHVDHGYFVYSPKLFHELALANGYEVRDLWFSGPEPHTNIFSNIGYRLDRFRDPEMPGNWIDEFDRMPIYDSGINVLMRKTIDRPFRLPLEISTSVASVDDAVRQRYEPPKEKGPSLMSQALVWIDRHTTAHPRLHDVLKRSWALIRPK